MNLAVKQENISQFMETIEEKKMSSIELQKVKDQNVSMMNRFF